MYDDDQTPKTLPKRKPDAPKSALFDMGDRVQASAWALILATGLLVGSDLFIAQHFGTVKVSRTWHGDWDAALAADYGWMWLIVPAAWMIAAATCALLPRMDQKQ